MKKKRISVALIAILVLLLSVIMIWGGSSSWGTVKMQRVLFTYATESGEYTGSGILMSPKSATTENKVPGTLILGGASSYSYALKSYGIELSRRGYTVLLADMPGQGSSNFVGHTGGYGNYKENAGEPGGGEDVRDYIEAATAYMQNLNYVDTSRLVISGFSAGQSWAVQEAVWNPGIYNTVITLSGYNRQYSETVAATPSNFIGIKGDSTMIERMTPVYELITGEFNGTGSFEDGTADYCYLNPNAVQHQMQPINGSLISAIVEAYQMAEPVETDLASTDLSYFAVEVWGAIAIIALFVLIACILKTLLGLEFFSSLKRHEPKAFPALAAADPSYTRRKIKAIIFLSIRTLIVIVLYELFAARYQIIPLFSGTAWAGLWINIWVPFLIANMLVNLILFLIWHKTVGKPNGGNAFEYGLSWEGGAKQNWANIGKCFVLGLSIVFIVLAFLAFLDSLLAINLKVMIFGMITFNLEHMLQMPFYIILYFALLLTASLTQYITNPSYEDGTTKSNVIASIRTTFIAILPYLVMVTWNTFKGTGAITMAGEYPVDQFAPLDNMYGYPIMMALITPIMDILRRKTKSLWPGVIVCAMILGVLIASNYSLNETWFG